jgi:hypothetical protein
MWAAVTKRVSRVPVTDTGTRGTGAVLGVHVDPDDEVDPDEEVGPDDEDADPPLAGPVPEELEPEHAAATGAMSRAALIVERREGVLSSMGRTLCLLAIEEEVGGLPLTH